MYVCVCLQLTQCEHRLQSLSEAYVRNTVCLSFDIVDSGEIKRSVSLTCLLCPNRSLERKLQRPLLAKSRTLPSIPQSPTVSRVHHSDLIGGSPPRRKTLPATTSHAKACTLPPAGKDKVGAVD